MQFMSNKRTVLTINMEQRPVFTSYNFSLSLSHCRLYQTELYHWKLLLTFLRLFLTFRSVASWPCCTPFSTPCAVCRFPFFALVCKTVLHTTILYTAFQSISLINTKTFELRQKKLKHAKN